MDKRNQSGITLIELMVVVVIIALFATIVGSRVFRSVGRAYQSAVKQQMADFETNLDLFRLDVGRYPTSEEGLQALWERPGSLEGWDGPYLKKAVPQDPWHHPYVYRFPGQHGDFDLLSLGADGQEGGEGDNADIVNWK